MPRFLISFLIGLADLFFAGNVLAEDEFTYFPGTEYDSAIPTFEDVLGYAPGERITSHAGMMTYFEALEAAAPDRVEIFTYARSWEGRDLIYVVFGSAENMSDLESIRVGMQALGNPENVSSDEADGFISSLPGVTWIAYGVHGNEISSTDAAMLTAYHLLAATGEDLVQDIMENSVVILDPLQNPDGRDRFVHGFEMTEGLVPDASPLSAEHDEPWPSGRVNHYLFDLNRDWFALTQPESRGKIAAYLDWLPLVYIDAHEMGSDQTYYFAPQARPYNPFTTDTQLENLFALGRNNAEWFDRFGFDYFTREVFDGFYPGYGDSWPKLQGAVASTYEQASARGLVIRKYDGTLMDYGDTVRHHFIASLATAEFVASNRENLLRAFYNYRRSAARENDGSYIIPRQFDQPAVEKLAGVLAAQGIEVLRANEDFRACGTRYDVGSYVVNAGQPTARLIRNLLDRNVPINEEFMKQQENRRDKDLPAEIYDVTAWSLPAMYNVEVDQCSSSVSGDFSERGDQRVVPGRLTGAGAEVAYLVPWGTRAGGHLLSLALRDGLTVKSSDEPFTHEGTEYPGGTLIFPVDENGGELDKKLETFAQITGANVTGIDSSWITSGPNFGSANVVTMPAPSIAIAWDAPTNAYSAGNTRFVIERQLGYPVSGVRTRTLASADLSEFDVIILPENWGFYGGYDKVLGKSGAENLDNWVKDGGTLILFGNALRFAADPEINLVSMRREDAYRENGAKENQADKKEEPNTVPGSIISSLDEYRDRVEPGKEAPDTQPGVIIKGEPDHEHWLAAGLKETLQVLVRGNDIYTPLTLDKGTNVVRFSAADDLVTSGYMWDENRSQMAFKPFLAVEPKGQGFVVSFTQDPTVRAYLDGLNAALMNAVFRSPAHADLN